MAQRLEFTQYSWTDWLLASILHARKFGRSLNITRLLNQIIPCTTAVFLPVWGGLFPAGQECSSNIRTFHPSWQGTKLTMVTGGAIGAARRTGIVAARQAMTWANLLTPRLEPGSASLSMLSCTHQSSCRSWNEKEMDGNGQFKFLRP